MRYTDGSTGYYKHYTVSDGTHSSVWISYPYPETTGYGSEPTKPEVKHPLHGRTVTDGTVHGRLIGTMLHGTVAKIKHAETGAIHFVDTSTIRSCLKTTG